VRPRGEYTLVIEGAAEREDEREDDADARDPLEEVLALAEAGLKPVAAVRRVAREHGVDGKELYRAWLAQRPTEE